MLERTYQKQCNLDRLNYEIVAAGLPIYPNAGARFYGSLGHQYPTYWETTVLLFDDATDPEKATVDAVVAAHIPTPLPFGPLPVEETTIFNALAIRDTSPHTSTVSTNIGYRVKTLIIQNGLNQDVTKQCQGSRDGVNNWFNIGDSFVVPAGTSVFQTCETYFPYVRGIATCSVAPTTGSLSMWVEKMGV